MLRPFPGEWPFSNGFPASLSTAGNRRPREGRKMGRRTWIGGLVLWAGLTGGHTAAAQTPSGPVIQVLIMDLAGVPAGTLERAQEDTTRVFHLSGIRLVWIDAETCQVRCLTVRIVVQPVSGKSRDPRVLGVAPGTKEVRGKNLWIFYPRIKAYSGELGMATSQLLGHVMAHELGHLLLPHGAHALSGVMRAEWDPLQVRNATRGTLTFTPDQAGMIRQRLQASASPIAHAR